MATPNVSPARARHETAAIQINVIVIPVQTGIQGSFDELFLPCLGLPRSTLDRLHDPRVRPAAADVGAHVLDDLLARRLRIRFSRSAARMIWPDWQ